MIPPDSPAELGPDPIPAAPLLGVLTVLLLLAVLLVGLVCAWLF